MFPSSSTRFTTTSSRISSATPSPSVSSDTFPEILPGSSSMKLLSASISLGDAVTGILLSFVSVFGVVSPSSDTSSSLTEV